MQLPEPDTEQKIQTKSKGWWESNPMSYDWHQLRGESDGTREFFENLDNDFLGSSPFYREGSCPFDGLIPFSQLEGKRVLEIGCGMGTHAQLFSQSGCSYTGNDLTARAVETTRKRLSFQGIEPDIRQMDAQKLEFGPESFDFVWSWGVIHHSANTEKIVREIHRVLKPGGECRLMVYHTRSIAAYVTLVRGILSGKTLKGMSRQDIYSHYSDGYLARFYTRSEFGELLSQNGFAPVNISLLGQKTELFPIPGKGISGKIKSGVLAAMPDGLSKLILQKLGVFLFAAATKPQGQEIVPFLDHVLVEAILKLPMSSRLDDKWPKPLLTKPLQDLLPEALVFRPKQGFTFPIDPWLRSSDGAFRQSCDGLNQGATNQVWDDFLSGRARWARPWALTVLSNARA